MNSETFPKNYLMYGKDRNIYSGGEFILVEKSIPSSLIPTNTTCELVWVQLHTCAYFNIILGSLYCPPNSPTSF